MNHRQHENLRASADFVDRRFGTCAAAAPLAGFTWFTASTAGARSVAHV